MTLGSLIAKARRDAGLSLEELAAKTNVRTSILREIEDDNFKNCGGETYARGHVRNIAAVLKADSQEFIRIFEEEQGEEIRTIQQLLVENSVMNEPSPARRISWKVLVMISVISLLFVGVAQIIVSNQNISGVVSATPSISATPEATPATSISPTAQPSVQTVYSSGTGVEVSINAARAKSWLFVSDAAGRTLFSGQLSLGSSKVFTTDSQINLKVGNAGGVDLTVNGKKVAAIGANGAVVSVSYGVDS
jgi:cytoskeletal protein RodZ